jgi:hypothetical protein
MESEQINNNEKKQYKDKIKQMPIHKQYLDDSETYEYSTKYKTENSEKNNSLIEELNKGLKKRIGFFPKKIFIEKPEIEEKNTNKRKYSMEHHLIIKDFVPQLKPIEIHVVPSKFRLNKKGFRDLKCNKDNKILLMSNNYFISCPNSEEESDISVSPLKNNYKDKEDNIKKTRKILQKMKSGNLPKVMSRNIIESNYKLYKDDFKIVFDSDSDNNSLKMDDNNLFLYDDNDFIRYNIPENNNKNKKEKEAGPSFRNNRINSCSILDVLKNRLSFDEAI